MSGAEGYGQKTEGYEMVEKHEDCMRRLSGWGTEQIQVVQLDWELCVLA